MGNGPEQLEIRAGRANLPKAKPQVQTSCRIVRCDIEGAGTTGTVSLIEHRTQYGGADALPAPGRQQGNIDDMPTLCGMAMQIQTADGVTGLLDDQQVAVRVVLLVMQALQSGLTHQKLPALLIGPPRHQGRFRPAPRQVQGLDKVGIRRGLPTPVQAWSAQTRGGGDQRGFFVQKRLQPTIVRKTGHSAATVRAARLVPLAPERINPAQTNIVLIDLQAGLHIVQGNHGRVSGTRQPDRCQIHRGSRAAGIEWPVNLDTKG